METCLDVELCHLDNSKTLYKVWLLIYMTLYYFIYEFITKFKERKSDVQLVLFKINY